MHVTRFSTAAGAGTAPEGERGWAGRRATKAARGGGGGLRTTKQRHPVRRRRDRQKLRAQVAARRPALPARGWRCQGAGERLTSGRGRLRADNTCGTRRGRLKLGSAAPGGLRASPWQPPGSSPARGTRAGARGRWRRRVGQEAAHPPASFLPAGRPRAPPAARAPAHKASPAAARSSRAQAASLQGLVIGRGQAGEALPVAAQAWWAAQVGPSDCWSAGPERERANYAHATCSSASYCQWKKGAVPVPPGRRHRANLGLSRQIWTPDKFRRRVGRVPGPRSSPSRRAGRSTGRCRRLLFAFSPAPSHEREP